MAQRAWSVREAGEQDADALDALFTATMGSSRSRRHQAWRYWRNPAGRAPILVAETISGDIIGQYALWPTSFRVNGLHVAGAQSLDTLTHPRFQGQGMFTSLARACYEVAAAQGIQLLYGFPNPASYPGFIRRLEWTHVGSLPLFSRVLHADLVPGTSCLARGLATLAARAAPTAGSSGDLVITAQRPSTSDLETFGRRCPATSVIEVDRGGPFYDWRYAPDADRDYRWWSAFRGSQLVGWATWGTDPIVAYPRGVLADLQADSLLVRSALVGAALRDARRERVALMAGVSNCWKDWTAYARSGFVPHAKLPLIAKVLAPLEGAVDPLRMRSWRLQGSDLDTF